MHQADIQAKLPAHIGLIMDGNGRWATSRGLGRSAGHRQGVEALRRLVRAAGDMGIPCLSIFAFSSENWSRPESEVNFLMGLLKRYIEADLAELHQSGVRVRVLGRRDGLQPQIASLIEHAEALTRENDALRLQVAFNYGAREEIADAAKRLAQRVQSGTLDPANITTRVFQSELLTAGLPDPDLIIRTSGEQRLSNFMLWQAAYAELYFTDVLWPDFDHEALARAVASFQARDRRFGGLSAEQDDTRA